MERTYWYSYVLKDIDLIITSHRKHNNINKYPEMKYLKKKLCPNKNIMNVKIRFKHSLII